MLFALTLALGFAAEHGRELQTCASWCNSFTCSASACSTCPVCAAITAGTHCEGYCNSHTCSDPLCAGCTACAPAAAATAPGFINAPLSGVFPPTTTRPKLVMAVDVDYPPYAYLAQAPYGSRNDLDSVIGVGVDMIRGMGAYCGFDVTVIQAHWADCWGTGEIGKGLLEGWYHGCMTYTHAAGVRNRYLEFSDSWALRNKPSGLIVKLNNGVPHINGQDTLNGRTIVDVTGWAPTADTLYFVQNQCTQTPYTGFTVVQGDTLTLTGSSGYTSLGPNDKALIAVLEGQADAMWVYADQASNYHCAAGAVQAGWNCDLWNTFGTNFAYVQVGMFGWMHNGTTISMSKKGSGLADILDPCFERFQKTQQFHTICATDHGSPPHNQMTSCIPNEFILADPTYRAKNISTEAWMFPTRDLTGVHTCATGYCSCSE